MLGEADKWKQLLALSSRRSGRGQTRNSAWFAEVSSGWRGRRAERQGTVPPWQFACRGALTAGRQGSGGQWLEPLQPARLRRKRWP